MTYISSALRNLVYGRAEGRCEYCLIYEGISFARHQIDHVIAEKHGGLTVEENLALSCTLCNKYKGSDIASIGETGEVIPLFNPRRDVWSEHFRIDEGLFIGLTPKGKVTIRLLQINSLSRIDERRSEFS